MQLWTCSAAWLAAFQPLGDHDWDRDVRRAVPGPERRHPRHHAVFHGMLRSEACTWLQAWLVRRDGRFLPFLFGSRVFMSSRQVVICIWLSSQEVIGMECTHPHTQTRTFWMPEIVMLCWTVFGFSKSRKQKHIQDSFPSAVCIWCFLLADSVVTLTKENVKNIKRYGGSFLGSSRFYRPEQFAMEIADRLERRAAPPTQPAHGTVRQAWTPRIVLPKFWHTQGIWGAPQQATSFWELSPEMPAEVQRRQCRRG